MIKFLFADGEDICLYSDGEIVRHRSKFIENYKNSVQNAERAKEWKHSGEGAQFRGDVRLGTEETAFVSSINGVYPAGDGEAVYSFKINGVSGIYRAQLLDEKAPEIHIINSVDSEFSGGCLDVNSSLLACSFSRNAVNSDIALFDLKTGDYKTLTEGDTLD